MSKQYFYVAEIYSNNNNLCRKINGIYTSNEAESCLDVLESIKNIVNNKIDSDQDFIISTFNNVE